MTKKLTRAAKKLMRNYWITLFIGISFAYFVWLTWNKLTDIIGDNTLVWIITGGIVLLAIIVGHTSFKKLAERFT